MYRICAMFDSWMPLVAAALFAVLLCGCAPVASLGKRVGTEGEVQVEKLQVYSFVRMHAMGSERLHRDAKGFDDALAGKLRSAKIDTVVADVEELVRRHGLPVEVRVSGHDGMQRSLLLPERDLLTANSTEETGDASPVAIGVLRYSVDARGFPSKRMAKAVVAKMNELGIR
jgi:hypothetical protein